MPRVTIGSFSVDVDTEWTLSTVILAGPIDKSPGGPPMLTAKEPRPFQRNIVATMEKVGNDETPERYLEKQLGGLRTAGINRQEAAPNEKFRLASGLEGLLMEQIIEGSTGELVHQMQLISIKNLGSERYAHTLIATHLDGEPFEQARASFRSILLSFE